MNEITIQSTDGIELFARVYKGNDRGYGSPRTLVIVHGTSEHGGRYSHVAEVVSESSWNVVTIDLRGHGRSGGVATHVDRFEQYLDDLDQVWSHFEFDPNRTVLLGHSFGGLVTARYAQTRPQNIGGLILMSPLLQLKVSINPLKLALGKLMSWIAPQFRFQSTVDVNETTRNQEVLERRKSDPLLHQSITAGWFFQMKTARAAVWEDVASINMPILALQGELDTIVDPLAIEPWMKKTPSRDQTFQMKTEHLHELLNEPDWQDTLQTIINWMDQRVPNLILETETAPTMG